MTLAKNIAFIVRDIAYRRKFGGGGGGGGREGGRGGDNIV